MRLSGSEALQIGTPIMLSGLPGGGSVTARVANCLPLGKRWKVFSDWRFALYPRKRLGNRGSSGRLECCSKKFSGAEPRRATIQ